MLSALYTDERYNISHKHRLCAMSVEWPLALNFKRRVFQVSLTIFAECRHVCGRPSSYRESEAPTVN